jgi:heme exporter protein B
MLSEIRYLIKKEATSEWRNKHTISGMLIYVVSTIFVCYLSFRRIVDIPTWNALYWIILLFAATNAIAKSFLQESKGKLLYYYTLTSPQAFIISKIIYNGAIMIIISLLSLLFYTLLIGNVIENMSMFIVGVIVGSTGFAANLTLIAAIASKANNNSAMTAILGFPVILPMLLSIIKFSKFAIDGIGWGINLKYLLVILFLNVIVVALSYILFPYLWRE